MTKAMGILLFLLVAAAAIALVVVKKKKMPPLSRKKDLLFRLGLGVLLVLALELSVFNYAAYASPSGEGAPLNLSEGETAMAFAEGQGLAVTADEESVVTWKCEPTDVGDIAVTVSSDAEKTAIVTVAASAADQNFSGLMPLYTAEEAVKGERTLYLTTSSKGMQQLSLTVNASQNVVIREVRLNAARPLSFNLLRVFLLILLIAGVLVIKTYALHQKEYDPQSVLQKVVAVGAILLCCIALIQIGTAHANNNNGSLLLNYDAQAQGKDPYYQQFDAFQKGQTNLDLPVDERLNEAGEQAYDLTYRSNTGISYAWDRAFYHGKYYSYFGIAPLVLFYYPVYFITGQVPTTALTCVFFSILIVIFGFMLIFRIARSIVKNANYLLTLLAATVLPLMSGIFILTAYGDFYNLPKLCALAFMLLLYYLTIAGYEKPRWYIFALCGLCVGIMLASRPNVLIMALSLAPLYIGVLVNREITLKNKLICLCAFLLPIALCAIGVMAYNSARFGSPLDFGAKYQLTVNNIAMNNLSLGFFGMAFYHYFLQPAQFKAGFPYLVPQFQQFTTQTRYFYVTSAFGVMSLPLNWGLLAYPAVRKRAGLRPAYRWTLVMSAAFGVLVALLDFALAGVTISYVCDIAATVAITAITVVLLAERCARGTGAHRIIYITAALLTAATFAVCIALLLGTEPLFVKNSMTDVYFGIRSLFIF